MASAGQRSSSFSSTLVDVFGFDASERRANVRSCDAGMLRSLSRSSAQHSRPSSRAEPGGASGPAFRSLRATASAGCLAPKVPPPRAGSLRLFRGLFLAKLRAAHQAGHLKFFVWGKRRLTGRPRGGMAASLLAVKLDDVQAVVLSAGIYDFKEAYDEVTIKGIKGIRA